MMCARHSSKPDPKNTFEISPRANGKLIGLRPSRSSVSYPNNIAKRFENVLISSAKWHPVAREFGSHNRVLIVFLSV